MHHAAAFRCRAAGDRYDRPFLIVTPMTGTADVDCTGVVSALPALRRELRIGYLE
jgi:hypothetical protein